MESISHSSHTRLNNSTGHFDLNMLDRNLFPGSFSNIEQFIHEVEMRCNYFNKIKKISFWNKITIALSIILGIVLIILIILYSEGEKMMNENYNWASYLIGTLVILIGFLFFLNSKYKIQKTHECRAIYSQNIDDIISNFQEIFNSYPLTVSYNIDVEWNFIFEISFDLIPRMQP